MNLAEKIITVSAVVVVVGLVLTHPSGDKAAGEAGGNVLSKWIGALYNAGSGGQ